MKEFEGRTQRDRWKRAPRERWE